MDRLEVDVDKLEPRLTDLGGLGENANQFLGDSPVGTADQSDRCTRTTEKNQGRDKSKQNEITWDRGPSV